jgi:hypothetical protein
MRKLKEVLRLHSLGLSQHQIARSCSVSQSTVHEYLSAAQAAGVQWPLPEHWGDPEIERALFPQRPAPAVWRKHPEPDWGRIHEELQTHKDLTLQLVWQEARENDPEGYGYSRYVASVFMLRSESSRRTGAPSAAVCSNITECRAELQAFQEGHQRRHLGRPRRSLRQALDVDSC